VAWLGILALAGVRRDSCSLSSACSDTAGWVWGGLRQVGRQEGPAGWRGRAGSGQEAQGHGSGHNGVCAWPKAASRRCQAVRERFCLYGRGQQHKPRTKDLVISALLGARMAGGVDANKQKQLSKLISLVYKVRAQRPGGPVHVNRPQSGGPHELMRLA
jgi:hypothetical protein